jgi:hypothetical protein
LSSFGGHEKKTPERKCQYIAGKRIMMMMMITSKRTTIITETGRWDANWNDASR